MRLLIICLAFLIPQPLYAASIAECLQELRPGAEWVVRGDVYDGIEWLDQTQTKPTRAEVATMKTRLENAEPMPSLQEQVEALLEGGQVATDMRARILRAKNKEPRQTKSLGR